MIRLTPRGLGLATAGVVLLIGAGTTGLLGLAWPGGLLLGLVGTACGVALISTRRPRARRRLVPDRVPAGSPVRAALDLDRGSAGLGGWAVVEETVPEGLGEAPALPVLTGWGRLRSQYSYQLATSVRGRYRIGPILWTTVDPLGLANTRHQLGERSLLTVTPAVLPLSRAAHGAGTGLVGEAAQRRSSVLGPDDALIREYRPRDELRRIHWPSTARTGTLMVRREEHAWEPSALILLDNRAKSHVGHGPRSSYEWAVSAAASIAIHLLDAGYDVNLAEAGGQQVAAAGETGRETVLDQLTDSTLTTSGDLGAALRARAGTRAQLVIAIVGRLSRTDALALTTARPHPAPCRAIVLQPPAPEAADPAEILIADGWRVVADARRLSVGRAWDLLDEAPGR